MTAAANTTGIPSSISLAYFGKSEALAPSDPTAALKACEHAVTVASSSGNRFWAMHGLVPHGSASHADW